MTLKKYLTSSDMEENAKDDDSETGSNLIFTISWVSYLTSQNLSFFRYVSWKVLKL